MSSITTSVKAALNVVRPVMVWSLWMPRVNRNKYVQGNRARSLRSGKELSSSFGPLFSSSEVSNGAEFKESQKAWAKLQACDTFRVSKSSVPERSAS